MSSRWWLLFTASAVVVSFFIGTSGKYQLIPTVEFHWPEGNIGSRYVPGNENILGEELVMVFIGSSTCVYSNDSALPAMVESAKLELNRKAADHGWSFSAIGVSVDWFASDGIDHLSKFGQFDEVIAGRGWHGTGADLYFRKIHGIDATPQILVLVRNSIQDHEGRARPIQKQVLAYRSAGLLQIQNWLKREFPLPQETFGGLASTDDP